MFLHFTGCFDILKGMGGGRWGFGSQDINRAVSSCNLF